MEATETRGAAPAEEAPQPAAAQTENGDSGHWLDAAPSEETALFGEFLRSDQAVQTAATSKPSSSAADGQSTPASGDEAPSDPLRDAAGRFIPRRGIPKAVAEAEARAAAAEAKAASLDPDALRQQIRAEIEAEQQQRAETEAQARLSDEAAADVARYERLRDLPSSEMSAEDWTWLEERKELLKQYPKADAHYRAQYERRAASSEQTATQRINSVLNGVVEQMTAVGSRLGIDTSAWKAPGVTFAEIAADIEAAVRAEYRSIEDENRQLRLTGPRGLAAARTGLNGGMSTGGAPSQSENDLFRQWLSR